MKKITGYFSLWLLVACFAQKITNTPPTPAIVNGKMYATFFQQRAAEYQALCYQAFNIARQRVDEWKPNSSRPTAIVTDIDETILDNSPYAAHQVFKAVDYDQPSWEEWTGRAKGDTLPGSHTFLKYAASKGIEIFYITNRLELERAGTLKNLQRFNLPNADNAHIIFKGTVSSKEARRQNLQKTHDILLLLGDNLADFSSLFDKKSPETRDENTKQSAAEFGRRFIVLPNTTYGDWENAVFKYNYQLSLQQKDSVIRSSLKGY
jgi:5'-nucleotidase (lipoprotein e(P4) family)